MEKEARRKRREAGREERGITCVIVTFGVKETTQQDPGTPHRHTTHLTSRTQQESNPASHITAGAASKRRLNPQQYQQLQTHDPFIGPSQACIRSEPTKTATRLEPVSSPYGSTAKLPHARRPRRPYKSIPFIVPSQPSTGSKSPR